MSYPLGSSLIPRIRVRRERWPGGYDVQSVPLVHKGTLVAPDQPVMRLTGKLTRTSLPQVPRLSLPAVLPGSGQSQVQSRQAMRNDILIAGLNGSVVGITRRGSVLIEGEAAVISGALGIGRQVAGPLRLWQFSSPYDQKPAIPPGTILAVPGPLNLEMLRQALAARLAGVIASSVSSRDFEQFLHTNLIDLLHCANVDLLLTHLPPLTVMLTEGLGTIAMPVRTINLISKHQGKIVLLSGATSLQAGVYPELLISLTRTEAASEALALQPETELIPGALVRVCSGSYEGSIGEINYLFAHSQLFPSGVRERAARIRLEDGSQLVVPLPVLERIG